MPPTRRNERGETLAEICVALVIIGAVIGAFFAANSTTSKASESHRELVTADATLRDYAEATKTAVRSQCADVSSTYSVSYTPPTGFSVNPLSAQPCPAPATAVQALELTVTLPNGTTKTLSIDVRTP